MTGPGVQDLGNDSSSSSAGCARYTLSRSVVQTDIERNPNHLAYGIDIISDNNGSDSGDSDTQICQSDLAVVQSFTVASCSFYDNLVQIWEAKFDTATVLAV